jgi:hypothetical protein
VIQLNNHSDNNSKYRQFEIKWGNINTTNIVVAAQYTSAFPNLYMVSWKHYNPKISREFHVEAKTYSYYKAAFEQHAKQNIYFDVREKK